MNLRATEKKSDETFEYTMNLHIQLTYVQYTMCTLHISFFHHLDFIRIYFTCKKKIREIHSLEKFWIMNLIWICGTNVER